MEDLASSIDRQTAEDLMRDSRRATSEPYQDQPTEFTELRDQVPCADAFEVASESSAHGRNDVGPDEVSSDDIFRQYMPDHLGLVASMEPRKSRVWFLYDSGVGSLPTDKLDFGQVENWRHRDDRRRGTLVIEDIKLDWCRALSARYPKTIDPEALADHVVRFDGLVSSRSDVYDIQRDLYRHYRRVFQVRSSGDFMAIDKKDRSSRRWTNGFQLDIRFWAQYGGSQERHELEYMSPSEFKGDVFERDALGHWKRISSRISCFRLEVGFYLILIDSTPNLEVFNKAVHRRVLDISSNYSFRSRPIMPLDDFIDFDHRKATGNMVDGLFHGHTMQSVFDPRSAPNTTRVRANSNDRMDTDIFTLLLAETGWRKAVERLESRLQMLRQEATYIAGGRAFEMMTLLRRQLANTEVLMADTEDWIKHDVKGFRSWDVDGTKLAEDKFWLEERSEAPLSKFGPSSLDIRDVVGLLERYKEKLQSMTKTVNQEIQMVIGSVQVEDARVMRRQTEWTVVLAVLAAIYLPMTLVTGIFGMNITEIGDASTAPDRWSVVKAWGVVFGCTIGSILVYAVVRYMMRYWRVGRMLLKRKLRKIGNGRLYVKLFVFKQRLKQLRIYRQIHGLREKIKEWDIEAQKLEKME